MNADLNILYVEDDAADAELVCAALAADGFACNITRVETEIDLVDALERRGFDLIFADYTLPSFDGLSALKIAQEKVPLVPFIFVSGTIHEDIAIEAMKIGATDYVFKTRLSRIAPSVKRALREATERNEIRLADEALRLREMYLAEAQRLAHTGSFGWDTTKNEIVWSLETYRIFDMDPGTRVSIELAVQRIHPDDREHAKRTHAEAVKKQLPFEHERRLLMPDGSIKYVYTVGRPVIHEDGRLEFVGSVTDISERKRAEADLRSALEEISKLKDQLQDENIALREEVDQASMFEEIVGQSGALKKVLNLLTNVAPTDSTVLLTGETGTGKELFARAIHKRSQRSSRPFVAVNCAAIPETLIASELFGHEKGAFTGANQRRLGRFDIAKGGTIFLDEIGELPQDAQAALLRVLQEGEFERVGGGAAIRTDVRVIAATNRDLKQLILEKRFRKDLFYRLSVFPIHLPPLRDRREDIPLLVEYLVRRYAKKTAKTIRSIEKRTMQLLESYVWPGNVRELQNVIERSLIVCERDVFTVDPSWISAETSFSEKNAEIGSSLATAGGRVFGSSGAAALLERREIEKALASSRGRVDGPRGAAALLKIPASTLETKIRSLKIDKQSFKNGSGLSRR